MRVGGIVLSTITVTLSFALAGAAFGSSLFFDADSDHVADTYLELMPGDTALLAVYLGGLAESTGSFQFDILYDYSILDLLDYDTFVGQPNDDPGLSGPIQTNIELGPWAVSQFTDPVSQELLDLGSIGTGARLFYTAGSLTQTAGGDGELAYVVFEASNPGRTTLDLQKPGGTWYLEGTTEQPYAIGIEILVIPEPGTMGLLSLGAIGFIINRRRRRGIS